MRSARLWCAALVLCGQAQAMAADCGPAAAWPRWEAFQAAAIAPEGRVVDHSDPRAITTSEGQGYALFLALVNGDRRLFQRLLRWTERELARGDLTAYLPAWLWGAREAGGHGVLDANTASDADLWIAYALLEAGRLWNEHRYAALGSLMLGRIAREELAEVPGLGTVLLPGMRGFAHDWGWVLNPSYMPPQIFERFARAQAEGPWAAARAALPRVLQQGAPRGYAADWIAWQADQQAFAPRPGREATGSYDAIRVYLWLGMLAPDAADAQALKTHFMAIEGLVDAEGRLPERIDILSGESRGDGPAGFSAAVLPLLRDGPHAAALARRAASVGLSGDRYYEQMLALFAEGWMQGRYRFDAQGALLTGDAACP